MQILEVTYQKTKILKLNTRNARTHSRTQIRQIEKSILEFGFANPILVDEQFKLIAGHGRLEAALSLKLDEVPVIVLNGLSELQCRALTLADNKLALNSGWDEGLLAEEIGELMSSDLEFDIDITGFTISEVDGLLEAEVPQEPSDPEEDIIPQDATGRVQPGDIWQLGPHRMICGDALNKDTVASLMDGALAQMVFTDPPYNVPIDGHVGGSGKIKHREFAMAVGEMSRDEFTAFLTKSFENLAKHSVEGSIHYVCMDWRHMTEILQAGEAVYDEMKNLIVWAKDNGGMGTFYRSRHELVFVFKKGVEPHINTFELGQNGRYRTNVWEYRGVNTMRAGRMEELALHPTVKPVQMIADAIKDVSGRGDIVLDLFGGSGSTLIAAHKTGRRAYLCELDPIYCDRIIQRWEAYAHDAAERLVTGSPAALSDLEVAQ